MAKLSVEAFLDYLRKSELTDENRLNVALAQIASEGNKENLTDADYIAGALTRKGLITRWHVRQLMKRKYKGFYLRQYRIMDHLGTGGMSTVYLAEHTLMHRLVAIKVLPKKRLSNSAYLDRFIREAQAIAALDHPHIVRAYDIDRYDDIHYIVMEYFEGNNLRQLVDKEGPLPYEDAVSYIRQGAEGLIHAHRIGVIHRDVKPENLLANAQGLAKLLDLGLALLDESQEHSASSSNNDKILGTADYLAPEQAIDSNKIDARADIYSLGCTLYFCLTGHPPFPFGTIPQRLLAHQRETPPSILLDRPDCPDDLVEICNKMMAKKPDDRFQSAGEVVEILGQWLIHHGFAEPQDLGIRTGEGTSEEFFSDQLSFLNDPWSATGLGEREDERRGGTGIGNEDVVNLFGSTVGLSGGSHSDIDATPENKDAFLSRFQPKEILLSQRLRSQSEEEADPLALALDEIKTGNHEVPSSTAKSDSTGHSTPTGNSGQPDDSIPTGPPQGPSPKTSNRSAPTETDRVFLTHRQSVTEESPLDTIRKNFSVESWHRQVPFWFWAMFVVGYVLAIFMAGLLCALILNLQ